MLGRVGDVRRWWVGRQHRWSISIIRRLVRNGLCDIRAGMIRVGSIATGTVGAYIRCIHGLVVLLAFAVQIDLHIRHKLA